MPAGLAGGRGFGVPGSGGSRRGVAVTGTPPSLPEIAPFAPETATPVKLAVLPFTQETSPVSFPSFRRSFAPSVLWVFEKFTNSPDCFTSNDGPRTVGWVGAVAGSGAPVGGGGGAPRHATGVVAS